MDAKDKQIKELTDLVAKLIGHIEVLEDELAKYRTPKNSSNSSVPPSKDENRPNRTQSLRKSGGKKSGGQPGHKGHTLEMSATPDHIVTYIPDFCNCCGDRLDHVEPILQLSRQEVDIPMPRIEYREHQGYQKTCLCGHTTTGQCKELFQDSIELKKKQLPRQYPGENIERSKLEKRLDRLLEECIDKKYKEVASMLKRLKKYRDHLLVFLYQYDVPPDNNGSERAIRNIKVKQKIPGQFRSFRGAQNFVTLRAVVDTLVKQSLDILPHLNLIAKLNPE